MPTEIPAPRRNSNRIEGVVKGQKPSCKVIIYRWTEPQLVGLEGLNISNQGDFFENEDKQDRSVRSIQTPLKIDNDIIKCNVHKNKNSSSGGFSLILKRGNVERDPDTGENKTDKKVTNNDIDYLKLINPGDWINIYMKKDDEIPFEGTAGSNSADSGLKMVGIIENVRLVEIDDPEGGVPRLEYVVTGRDFGKVFENEIYFNPVIAKNPALEKVLGAAFLQDSEAQFEGEEKSTEKSSKVKAFSADQIIKNMVNFYLRGGNPVNSVSKTWLIPQTLAAVLGGSDGGSKSIPFVDVLNLDKVGLQKFLPIDEDNDEKYDNWVFDSVKPLLGKAFPAELPDNGTVWNAMKKYSNPVLNEFIVDLTESNGRLVPSLQLRQVPYSNRKWSNTNVYRRSPVPKMESLVSESEKTDFLDLPRHKIKSTDIKQKNVGKSDFERINAITMVPDTSIAANSSQVIEEAYSMALNVPSIQRHGLRTLTTNSFFTFERAISFIQYSKRVTALLADWFMTAHLFYNGTIVTDGPDDFVEIGSNLLIEDVNQIYHIEGISYMYDINRDTGNTIYNAEFRVSRGQLVDNDYNKSDFLGAPIDLEEDQGVTVFTSALENIRNTDE